MYVEYIRLVQNKDQVFHWVKEDIRALNTLQSKQNQISVNFWSRYGCSFLGPRYADRLLCQQNVHPIFPAGAHVYPTLRKGTERVQIVYTPPNIDFKHPVFLKRFIG